MRVIVPNQLELLTCSVAESNAVDGPAWSAAASYNLGDAVRYKHISYKSLADGNKGMNPELNWSGTGSIWKKMGATTPYRMLDEYVETQTSTTGNLSFCVPYDNANSFALLNLTGDSARIRIYDDDDEENPVFYDETISLKQDIFHISLWEYNYLPIINIPNFVQTDMPDIVSGKLCVEIFASGDTAAVGHVLVGNSQELGYTQYGAEVSLIDYSRKEVDEFGRVTLVRRSCAHRIRLPIYLHPEQSDYVGQVLDELRGIPALWVGDNETRGHSSLTAYGWMEEYSKTYEGPDEVQLTLEIQGLI